MSTEKEDLLNIVTNVLGLSIRKYEVISNGGYDTISNIISEWCTTNSELTTNRGRATYGQRKIN